MFHLTPRMIPAGCLCLAAALAVGCESQPDREGDDMTGTNGGAITMMPSPTLLDATGEVLADAMQQREQAGADLPPGYQSREFTDMVVESIRLQFPEAYNVTEAEERRIQAGELDDEANAQRIDQLLDRLDPRGDRLNTVTTYLVEMYREDQLQGVGLELTARLLSAQLSTADVNVMPGGGEAESAPVPPLDAGEPQGAEDRQPRQSPPQLRDPTPNNAPEQDRQPAPQPEPDQPDEPDLRIAPEEDGQTPEQAPEPPAEEEQPEELEEEPPQPIK